MTTDLIHGGALEAMQRQFPDAPQPWLDLSTGINPFPYVIGNLPPGCFTRLPGDAEERAARETMAAAWQTDASHMVLTPGSEAALQLLPRLLNAQSIGVVAPTYGGHATAWRAAGRTVLPIDGAPSAFPACEALIIVNPNNPDGRRVSPAHLLNLAREASARGSTLIVDEAFADLEPALSVASHAGLPGLLVLRSFGKFFGLAGLRLGALLGPPRVVAMAKILQGSWAVSGPALAIAAKAYGDSDWAARTRLSLAEQSASLDRVLSAGGLAIEGGTTLFRYVHHPDAHELWRHLARQGIYVRRFDWSPHHLRIGLPGKPDDLERIAEALRA